MGRVPHPSKGGRVPHPSFLCLGGDLLRRVRWSVGVDTYESLIWPPRSSPVLARAEEVFLEVLSRTVAGSRSAVAVHEFASNWRNSVSNFHCKRAFSLASRNFWHAPDGDVTPAHSLTTVNAFPSRHRLAPPMKACSRLVRAICFN